MFPDLCLLHFWFAGGEQHECSHKWMNMNLHKALMANQHPGRLSSGVEARCGHERLETHPDEPDLFWSAETPTWTVPLLAGGGGG